MHDPTQSSDDTSDTTQFTQRSIKAFYEGQGGGPKKALGQNFLIDHNYLPLMSDAAELSKQDNVLEIGPGFGVLTHHLLENAGQVLSVELDHNLSQVCRERFGDHPNHHLIEGDALAKKNTLNPIVQSALDELGQFKVVANLPYKISTSFVARMLFNHAPPSHIVILIQEEFADRLMAKENTKEYGTLSVFAQLTCDIHLVRKVPGSSFYPPPSVGSAIVCLKRKTDASQLCTAFEKFTADLFLHRRKKVKGRDCRPGEMSPHDVLAWFKANQA